MPAEPNTVPVEVETLDKVRSSYETLLVVRNNHRHLDSAAYQYAFENAVMALLEETETDE